MFLELIATLVAGFAAAGLVLFANRLLRGRLPKWFTPVAAGATMIAVTIFNEYGWYDRTRAGLPPALEVAQTVENRSLIRPWTYLAPYVERFVAVDTSGLQSHAEQPNRLIAQVFFFGRWSPVERMSVLVDCQAGTRAALSEQTAFDPSGGVEGVNWVHPASDDPLMTTICKHS